MFGDEIWDEDRWEAFLRENDRRMNRFMSLLFNFMTDNPPPDREATEAYRAWEQDLRAYLLNSGLSQVDAVLDMLSQEQDAEDEGWMLDDGPFAEETLFAGGFDNFRHLPVYQQALELASDVLAWSNELPGEVKDSTFVQFCAHITQIPTNIAKGHGIGYEQDTLGGNIACAKRGLAAANDALDLLRELKQKSYVDPTSYRVLYEQTYEVRNEVGLYIQDLRRRFDLGID